MPTANDFKIDDELAAKLAALLKELLEQEHRSVTGADDKQRNELRQSIQKREALLADESELERLFERHIAVLSVDQRPVGNPQKWRMFAPWEGTLRSKLAGWKADLAELENRPIDRQKIFTSASNKVMYLLQREAQAADLWPPSDVKPPSPKPKNGG